jgi:transcriptional regulator with AAA-type ATPase domain
MPSKTKIGDSLTKLLDASSRPIYAVDSQRQIVYGNAALASWLGLELDQIVGREVEYHSEPDQKDTTSSSGTGPLAALCPPPRALAGEPCTGTVSCVARDGRLIHRQAEFIPLATPLENGRPRETKKSTAASRGGVLVVLGTSDMSPHELASGLSGDPTDDELHRAIRRFRRTQATQYAAPSLLGDSSAIQKARAQAAAAAASGANVLILGRPGTGRGHVARVIHYTSAADASVKLVPIDCGLLNDDNWRRTLDSLRGGRGDARQRPTLLLENIERLAAPLQSQLVEAIRQNRIAARIMAICDDGAFSVDGLEVAIQPPLLDLLSTITIRAPRLVDRLADLPILAQCFLEASNQGSQKQVGSIRPEALDLLALHGWPGELDELRGVIAAAHRAATTPEISSRDLPVVIHHALNAAAAIRHPPERIVLDEFLATIEKKIIERALAQANGNKTEAAALLGMPRPRLYRRLVQLGLVNELAGEPEPQQPEFIERDSAEHEP